MNIRALTARMDRDESLAGEQTGKLWLKAATLYFAAAISTIHLTTNGHDVATLWPANAILVALLLSGPRPRWMAVLSAGFFANIAANLITRGVILGPSLYAAANLLEVTIAVHFLRKGDVGDGILQSTGSVVRFFLIAGVLAPLVSGIPGSVTAYLFFGEPILKAFYTWIASDGLGLLVFTPFFLAVFQGHFVRWIAESNWRQRIECLALLGLVAAVAGNVFFYATRPMLFAIFPVLMLITFRLGRLGAKAAVIVIAIIGALATLRGYGPIVRVDAGHGTQILLFQTFLAVLLLTCLPVAAEITARARLTAQLAAYGERMTISAHTDPLTGILNRAGFEIEATKLLHAEPPGTVSVIAIDFDRFKQINDAWGHQTGDRALQHLVSVFLSNVRPSDVIGRLGGDEFMIILRRSNLELARAVGERIRADARVLSFAVSEMSVINVSVSMGIAVAKPGEAYDALIQRSDRAMYEAKNAGRNTIRSAD